VPLFDTGGTKYQWSPAYGLDNPTSWNPTATPGSSQSYTVIAQLASCIPDTDYVSLTIYQLPTVYAGADQRLLAGSVAQLDATGTLIAKYAWSPSGDLSCSTCASPLASMSVTTTFIVDVLSDYGCHAQDSVTILLYCDNSQIFIPNSFTPNGDGKNDVFYPRGKGVKNIKTFRIYNRWGELMYQNDNIGANDAGLGWDGSFKGGAPRPDVYVYLLEADCSTGEPISIKGDVTIIR
jgi:gliding motility-associated-like protein